MVGLANPSSAPAPLRLFEEPWSAPAWPLPRRRRDALPEHTDYNDTGCDLHPSCLACPLVRCRYDEPGGARRIASDERDRAIVRLRREDGLQIGALALRFAISRRTVFRVLARAAERTPDGPAQAAQEKRG